MKKIAIIGAGPAGMSAAIAAARSGAKVTLFERNDIVGKKLLLTGNGRCNFTNTDMHTEFFSFAEGSIGEVVLATMSSKEVCDFFEEIGVLHIERKGCFYPFSGQAQTIQSSLLYTMETCGVELILNTCVTKIGKEEQMFIVHTEKKEYRFDAVILACGGKAAPKTGSDGFGYRLARGFGHTVSRTYPVLVQLVSNAKNLKMLAGVRCQANVTAFVNGKKVARDYGELQLTDYGLSGIPVFNISRFLSKDVEEGQDCVVEVDFIPQISNEMLTSFVNKRIILLDGYTLKNFMNGLVHSKVADYVLNMSNMNGEIVVKPDEKDKILNLLSAMKEWKFSITGHKGFEHAQVTKGGVLLEEIDGNMESKLEKSLFFAGEMVDVDADCGGYNLHWAWASGRKAGEVAAK